MILTPENREEWFAEFNKNRKQELQARIDILKSQLYAIDTSNFIVPVPLPLEEWEFPDKPTCEIFMYEAENPNEN